MDDSQSTGGLPMGPAGLPSINPDCQRIFAHPAISATTPPGKSGSDPAALLDGLAVAVALFEEAKIVLNVFIVRILASGRGKRCMRALVVAAQHI